jgi:RNA polymerase sigma-70 factor (ECF subfamily)
MSRSPDFERRYREHYRAVLGLCRRLLGRSGYAEDAAQEAFMRAYNAFAEYDASQPFGAWVSRIARNHCIDLIRRRSNAVRLFDDEDIESLDVAAAAASVVSELIADERAAALQRAIDGLPDRYRVPLVLAYLDGASYDEIAATLGITRNHVGVLLLRAKQLLRKALAGAEACTQGGEP